MKKIQEKREEMIRLGNLMGLDAKETIQCSQELDQLLNHYQHFCVKKQIKTTKRYRSGKKLVVLIREAASSSCLASMI
ncbi:MAG: aspartyl-phosphate phosphatase Spo0E family protein [Bacillales bacterium]|nr:aspartyl-phosphate phosphatase Spo0E family protein [Bacillales bacterium]